jgi:glycosyltransferase involved in cell wall biosynthesis
MFFSIVVPTYNEEQYIERCLRSILNQDVNRSDYEIIVSDGNSLDKTRTIAEELADKIVVKEQRGASIQRNYGSQHANGDILVFVDADTQLDCQFLSMVKQQFSNTHVVGVTGIAFPADGRFLQRFVYRATYWLVHIFHWFNISLFPGMCVAYRRPTFKQVNGFREDFTTLEDLDLSKRISTLGKMRIASKAHAFVSTRRIEQHLITTVAYHIYCDMRYLLTGKGPHRYPKVEEIHTWKDLWKTH